MFFNLLDELIILPSPIIDFLHHEIVHFVDFSVDGELLVMSRLLEELLRFDCVDLPDLGFLLLKHALHRLELTLLLDQLILVAIRSSLLVLDKHFTPRFFVLDLAIERHIIGLELAVGVLPVIDLLAKTLDFILQTVALSLSIPEPVGDSPLLVSEFIHGAVPPLKVPVNVIHLRMKADDLFFELGDLDVALLESAFKALDVGLLV